MKKIYTLKEIAKILKFSERQIFRYLKTGKLKGSKHGKWLFTEDDIKRFLDLGRTRVKPHNVRR